MAAGESMMENDTEIFSFLLMVLDQGNELMQEGSVTDECKTQVKSCVELVEYTIGILWTFLDVLDNGNDRIVWEKLAG